MYICYNIIIFFDRYILLSSSFVCVKRTYCIPKYLEVESNLHVDICIVHFLGWKAYLAFSLHLCPSPTVPNLLPNEDEWTIRFGSSDHSWSFLVIRAMTMTMTIDLNSVLLMHVASTGQYEVFECVPSTNNLHSCLCALRMCSYRVCRTTYVLYSSRFPLYTTSFMHVHFRQTECECDLMEKKRTESSSYYFRTIRERFENDSHCHSHW